MEITYTLKRVHKEAFTVVGNDMLRDSELGNRDCGILLTMLSFRDDWRFSIRGLASILPDGEAAITSALKRLEEKGYLRRGKKRNSSGRIESILYEVSDTPVFAEAEKNSERRKERVSEKPQLAESLTASQTAQCVLKKVHKAAFTVVGNDMLRDPELAARERGLLGRMLSFADGWRFSIRGLAGIFPDGQTATASSLKLLEQKGYLQRQRMRDAAGRLTVILYQVSDAPIFLDPKTLEDVQQKERAEEQLQMDLLTADETLIAELVTDGGDIVFDAELTAGEKACSATTDAKQKRVQTGNARTVERDLAGGRQGRGKAPPIQ